MARGANYEASGQVREGRERFVKLGKHLVYTSGDGGGFDGKGAFSSCPLLWCMDTLDIWFQTLSDMVEGVMWLVCSGQFKNNENQAKIKWVDYRYPYLLSESN